MSDSSLDMLGRVVTAFRQAMADEGVQSNTVARIVNRVLYGDPGGPAALYEIREDGSTAVHMGPKPAFRPGMDFASGLDIKRVPHGQPGSGELPEGAYIIKS